MRCSLLTLAAATLALAGCVGGADPAPRTTRSAAPVRSGAVRAPQVMASAGLERVIGSPAAALTGRLGTPRLDVREGDVRKLQFAGANCVVDIYLYPLSPGAEPTASHVEARLRQGGAGFDAGACIREVARR